MDDVIVGRYEQRHRVEVSALRGRRAPAQLIPDVADPEPVDQLPRSTEALIELGIVRTIVEREDVHIDPADPPERSRATKHGGRHAAVVVADPPCEGEVPAVRKT